MFRVQILHMALALTVFARAGCEQSTAPSEDLGALLPDDAPFITGTIVARDNRFDNTQSVRVAENPVTASYRESADVLLQGAGPIYWRNGSLATAADLSLGRVLTVWAGPTVMKSLPPVIDARFIVIER